jgi:hypothetical protein
MADRVRERELCSRELVAGGWGPFQGPHKIEGEHWSDEYENYK